MSVYQSFRLPSEPATSADYARMFREALTNIAHPDHAICSSEFMALARQEAAATFGNAVDAPFNPHGYSTTVEPPR